MTTSPRLALVGGTSLLESSLFRDATPIPMVTPYGPVTLLDQDGLLFLQRHTLDAYTPPHRINHQANIHALHQAGAKRILSVGSVGSLRDTILPGTLVVPDDFYAPHLGISFFDDQKGHKVPGFHPQWRETILETWRASNLPPPHTQGVYWQTIGPRFETPAEIRMHQPHVHVVGMTVAAECILAGELDVPYAAICMVDNFANGLSNETLSYESLKARVHANEALLLKTIKTLIRAMP